MIKKIICLFLLFLSFKSMVNADELWKEYLEDGISNYEKEVRYKWYKEQIEGEYLEYGQTSSKYSKVSDIPFYGEYTKWSEDCKSGYDIESKKLNGYKKVKEIRYLKISNFSKSTSIKTFGATYSGTPTNTQLYKASTISTNPFVVDENSYIIIDLKREYEIQTIAMRVDLLDRNTNYTITMSDDNTFNNIIATYKYNSKDTYSTAKNGDFNDYSWEDIVYTEDDIEEDGYTKIYKDIELCRYRHKYYYWFNITRKYYGNDYYTNVDGYIKDIDNYKVFYKYDDIPKSTDTKYVYLDKEIIKYKNSYVYNYLPKEIEKIEYRYKNNNSNSNCTCSYKKCKEQKCSNIDKSTIKEVIKLVLIIMLLLVFLKIIKIIVDEII